MCQKCEMRIQLKKYRWLSPRENNPGYTYSMNKRKLGNGYDKKDSEVKVDDVSDSSNNM